MSHRLSDSDRTLLSAFMDGELNAGEIRDAEQLLGSSEEARTYLGQLRAVRSFSVQAFPAVPIGAATGTAAAAGKLTASAISAAAKKSAIAKGFIFGPWSTFGVVAAAASIAVGVTVAMNGGGGAKQHSEVIHPAASVVQAAALASPVSVDTNALIVPPMTPAEVVRFAVNGTLPIDSKRKQYLTLAAHGQDSMVVALHDGPPADFAMDLDNVAPSQWRELDSVHRALRTALLQYKGGNIAISCDIPSLQLKTLEHLSRIGSQFPPKLQEELSDAKHRIEAARAKLDALRIAKMPNMRSNRIPYVVISLNDLDQDGTTESIRIPDQTSAALPKSARFMIVDGVSLGELQALAPPTLFGAVPIPPTPPETFVRRVEVRQRTTTNTVFNPTGERPSTQTLVQQSDTVLTLHPDFNDFFLGDSKATFGFGDSNQQIWFDDSLVEKVQQALRIADSTMQHFDLQMMESMRNQRQILIKMHGNGNGSADSTNAQTDDNGK